jgi:hypothetical protein
MMQPVARRDAKIPDAGCGIEDQELAEGGTLHLNRNPFTRSHPKSSFARRSAKPVITPRNSNA